MLKKVLATLIASAFLVPSFALAMQMPDPASVSDAITGVSADSYVVQNIKTGEILFSKNANARMIPASLTKLVTALVVMDTKPKLGKTVAISQADQIAGACKHGGDCIKAKAGTKFTIDGLFHAALLPSANNAANALARSTGMSSAQFAKKMNAKVKALGAKNSVFYEPTGMSSSNRTTAADYAKIVAAAYSNPYLKQVAQKPNYYLESTNNSNYSQYIKNSDKLLASEEIEMLGAKTGYLGASYNFASLLKYQGGPELAVVVLGEPHLYSAFADTRTLSSLADAAKLLSFK